MFFATPHLGLSKAMWRHFAIFVLQQDAPTKGTLPTREMVRKLRASSEALLDISEDFKPLHRYMSFVTFYESDRMKGSKHLVCTSILPSVITNSIGIKLIFLS